MIDMFANPEMLIATAISNAWKAGVRHPIALANAGIVCAERTAVQGHLSGRFEMLV
ncbi:hypothetical protein JQ629_35215 [Bradyrhizobium sp. AUGA SZCCT0222]|uniref:hypothetical protein n=1 Tax=Bradyrhizobium sp. AUGA SZCCT0222 TaxID=2807668 RepID=UPI001BA7F3EF|nr:hypothetical protein [Bradyrhizobium sp. AUGA SZCCT0222]MBR1272741.1 hypothetical protein [Bradyrhizobium sp. AUGA SZCCT0222]